MCLNNLCSSSPGLHKNWARSGYTDTPHLGCLAVLGILIRCIKCSLAALLGEMKEFEPKLKATMTKWWPGMKRIANMKKCDIPEVSLVQCCGAELWQWQHDAAEWSGIGINICMDMDMDMRIWEYEMWGQVPNTVLSVSTCTPSHYLLTYQNFNFPLFTLRKVLY